MGVGGFRHSVNMLLITIWICNILHAFSTAKQENLCPSEGLDQVIKRIEIEQIVGEPDDSNKSIIARGSQGNLGNKMFSYMILTFISKQFGLKTFTTKYVYHHIDKIFKISDKVIVEVIEDSLCQAFNGLTVIEKMDAFGYNEEENIECDVTETISFEYFTG